MVSNGNSAARTLPHSVFLHPLGSSQQGRWLLSGHILRTSVLRQQEVDAARPVRAIYRTHEIIPVNSMGQCIPKPVPMEGRREIDPCLHGRVPRSHCRPGAAGDTAMVTFTKHGLLHHGKWFCVLFPFCPIHHLSHFCPTPQQFSPRYSADSSPSGPPSRSPISAHYQKPV